MVSQDFWQFRTQDTHLISLFICLLSLIWLRFWILKSNICCIQMHCFISQTLYNQLVMVEFPFCSVVFYRHLSLSKSLCIDSTKAPCVVSKFAICLCRRWTTLNVTYCQNMCLRQPYKHEISTSSLEAQKAPTKHH